MSVGIRGRRAAGLGEYSSGTETAGARRAEPDALGRPRQARREAHSVDRNEDRSIVRSRRSPLNLATKAWGGIVLTQSSVIPSRCGITSFAANASKWVYEMERLGSPARLRPLEAAPNERGKGSPERHPWNCAAAYFTGATRDTGSREPTSALPSRLDGCASLTTILPRCRATHTVEG